MAAQFATVYPEAAFMAGAHSPAQSQGIDVQFSASWTTFWALAFVVIVILLTRAEG